MLNNLGLVIVAFCADAVLGDPRRWPHIAKAAGWLAKFWEARIAGVWPELQGAGVASKGTRRTVFRGFLFWWAVCGSMIVSYKILHALLALPALQWLLDAFIIYQALATRDLANHVRAILTPLESGDLPEARRRLSWIVGRDTADLNEPEICRATIEAVAESLCDGVIAPLFWGVVFGAPGALLYRTVNTLDSIAGHRTPRYEAFGKLSARMDDVMSWLPARYTAKVLEGFIRHRGKGRSRLLSEIAVEARQHTSPNAGWPEATMARVLGVRLGGTNFYGGESIDGPVFFAEGRSPTPADVARCLKIIWLTVAIP